MTEQQQHDSHQGDVLGTRERVETSERLVSRTCAWCGAEMTYSGSGRPRRYCSDSHRRRADEARNGARRADAATARGERTTEPVREVVERTATTVRTVYRPGPKEFVRVPAPPLPGRPQTPQEWVELLGELGVDINRGVIPEHWHTVLQPMLADLLRRVGGPEPSRAPAVPQQPQPSRAERRRQEREDRKRRR
ncbi:hypothetical protein ACH4E7_43730 [Kitasatospora sp. NPDC018058]|uniref:hypothetical protein n=1 Tax=Kitasatospora sp. NPDC018058 TaxID=3364025 RepID=UPI0037BFB82A